MSGLPTASEAFSGVFNVRETLGVWGDRASQQSAPLVTITRPLPRQLIDEFIEMALERATLRQDDEGWFAEIAEFNGVWAKEESPMETFNVLREVLFEWLLLKMEHRDGDIPTIGSADLNCI